MKVISLQQKVYELISKSSRSFWNSWTFETITYFNL